MAPAKKPCSWPLAKAWLQTYQEKKSIKYLYKEQHIEIQWLFILPIILMVMMAFLFTKLAVFYLFPRCSDTPVALIYA